MINPGYVIVQAGGKGTRLKDFTRNKPKAIVSVNNLPIIFHLFRKFPDKKFVIIGDYKKDVMEKYLDVFSEVQYIMVGTDGKTGTCSGIRNALDIIPPDSSFMLIWSDLVLGKGFELPTENGNYIGISGTFPCRWMYRDGKFKEERSTEDGVAGLFIFKNKTEIIDVPDSGEFVKWLCSKKMTFQRLTLGETAEYGLVESINLPKSGKCRPFNSLKIEGSRLIKEGIDEQGKKLAVREKAWYRHVAGLDIPIPIIYSYNPFTIERISGKNIFEYNLSEKEKTVVLIKIMNGLSNIHTHDRCYPDRFSINKAYYEKTLDRISKVRNMIPFANVEYIVVNGKKCRNAFFYLDEIKEKISKLKCSEFCLIHGDCTFSNIILRDGKDPIFIDPRGYFGNCEIIGDPLYDWSKLYYSVCGDYDQFNLGRFQLYIDDEKVRLDIKTNGWKDMENVFANNLPSGVDIKDVRFIHALIWLSLTTYAWDDYDSICGAFYNGIFYLEDVL